MFHQEGPAITAHHWSQPWQLECNLVEPSSIWNVMLVWGLADNQQVKSFEACTHNKRVLTFVQCVMCNVSSVSTCLFIIHLTGLPNVKCIYFFIILYSNSIPPNNSSKQHMKAVWSSRYNSEQNLQLSVANLGYQRNIKTPSWSILRTKPSFVGFGEHCVLLGVLLEHPGPWWRFRVEKPTVCSIKKFEAENERSNSIIYMSIYSSKAMNQVKESECHAILVKCQIFPKKFSFWAFTWK